MKKLLYKFKYLWRDFESLCKIGWHWQDLKEDKFYDMDGYVVKYRTVGYCVRCDKILFKGNK